MTISVLILNLFKDLFFSILIIKSILPLINLLETFFLISKSTSPKNSGYFKFKSNVLLLSALSSTTIFFDLIMASALPKPVMD